MIQTPLMPQRLIYATKDLRNAIAHNDVVFDTRFRTGSIDKQVGNAISNATGVKGISSNPDIIRFISVFDT